MLVFIPEGLEVSDFKNGYTVISKKPFKDILSPGFLVEGYPLREKYMNHLIIGTYAPSRESFLSKEYSCLDGNYFRVNYNPKEFKPLTLEEYYEVLYSISFIGSKSPTEYLGTSIAHLRNHPNILAVLAERVDTLDLATLNIEDFIEGCTPQENVFWSQVLIYKDISYFYEHYGKLDTNLSSLLQEIRAISVIPSKAVVNPTPPKPREDVEIHSTIALANYVSLPIPKPRNKKKRTYQILSKEI
jgi:hypothetical protein